LLHNKAVPKLKGNGFLTPKIFKNSLCGGIFWPLNTYLLPFSKKNLMIIHIYTSEILKTEFKHGLKAHNNHSFEFVWTGREFILVIV
jgi:hypothetical protein